MIHIFTLVNNIFIAERINKLIKLNGGDWWNETEERDIVKRDRERESLNSFIHFQFALGFQS